MFLTRAHAQGLETEVLGYREAQALSRRIRAAGGAISSQSMLNEVREREEAIRNRSASLGEKRQRQKKRQPREVVSAQPQAPAIPQSPQPTAAIVAFRDN